MDLHCTPPGSRTLCDLPDSVLLQVLTFLSTQSLGRLARSCSRFRDLVLDTTVWKELFCRHFNVPRSVPMLPSAGSWRAEYERLCDHTPVLLCEELNEHSDEVWHVSFSHNGRMFATSAKDGGVAVWNVGQHCTLLFRNREYLRKAAQFSQFNQTDTQLLVSFKKLNAVSSEGEIAVYDLKEFKQLYRVPTTPAWVFGCWFDNCHILLSRPSLNAAQESSTLCLYKTSQAIESEDQHFLMFNLYRIKNLDMMLVADCESGNSHNTNSASGSEELASLCSTGPGGHDAKSASGVEEYPSVCLDCEMHDAKSASGVKELPSQCSYGDSHNANSASGTEDFPSLCSGCETRRLFDPQECEHNRKLYSSQDNGLTSPRSSGKICNDKLIILTKKWRSSVVCVKRVKLQTLLANPERHKEAPLLVDANSNHQYADSITETADCSLNVNAEIVGMVLSSDQRFLFMSTRQLSQTDCTTKHPLVTTEVQVIDLNTFQILQKVMRSESTTPWKEFTSVYLHLDVSQLYVASGAEEKCGYLWDRHYGICVHRLSHNRPVVNSMAFNPRDQEMLVTVSDDMKIKVWRSRRKMRHLRLSSEDCVLRAFQ